MGRLVAKYQESLCQAFRTGAAPGLFEYGCPVQKFLGFILVGWKVTKSKEGDNWFFCQFYANVWQNWVFRKLNCSKDGCQAHVSRFLRVPRHPWHPYCRGPCQMIHRDSWVCLFPIIQWTAQGFAPPVEQKCTRLHSNGIFSQQNDFAQTILILHSSHRAIGKYQMLGRHYLSGTQDTG